MLLAECFASRLTIQRHSMGINDRDYMKKDSPAPRKQAEVPRRERRSNLGFFERLRFFLWRLIHW